MISKSSFLGFFTAVSSLALPKNGLYFLFPNSNVFEVPRLNAVTPKLIGYRKALSPILRNLP